MGHSSIMPDSRKCLMPDLYACPSAIEIIVSRLVSKTMINQVEV